MIRAVASSIASGRPSSRRQISATAAALSSVSANSGRTARARSTKSWIASNRLIDLRGLAWPAAAAGSDSGGTGNSCSPRMWSASRLVTSTLQVRTGLEQLRDRAGGRRHLLEVVEDQQDELVAQPALELVEQRLLAGLGQSDRAGDGRQGGLGVGDGGEVDEEDPVVEPLDLIGGRAERQPGLAAAARPDQRDQPDRVRRELGLDGRQLDLPADERRGRHGQVVRPVVERPQRGNSRISSGWASWKRRSVRSRSLSRCSPSSTSVTPVGQLVLGQGRRGLGQQDLAAMRRGHDPGGAMDLDPDVAAPFEPGLAGMDRHPDPDLRAVGPQVRGHGSLHVESAADRIGRVRERREERVALGVDLDPVPALDGGSDDPPMVEQDPGVGVIPELGQEPGRALDVGEQERDRPARKLERCLGTRTGRSDPCPACLPAPRRSPAGSAGSTSAGRGLSRTRSVRLRRQWANANDPISFEYWSRWLPPETSSTSTPRTVPELSRR